MDHHRDPRSRSDHPLDRLDASAACPVPASQSVARRARWAAVLASALVLAACGGGGGGGGGNEPPAPPPQAPSPPPPPPPPPPGSFTLAVSVTGNGTVANAAGTINCGSVCSTTVPADTAVTLTATPAAGQVLQTWGGACAGASGTSCTVTVTQATNVSATFAAAPPTSFTLAVTAGNGGRVASQPAGIDCGSTCSASFGAGTDVTLTATPSQGFNFQSWSGACSGSAVTCTVTMSAARSVSATFATAPAPSRAWGTATLLENSNDFNVSGTNFFADTPALAAMDAAGNALVVWEQSDGVPNGDTRKVFSRRYVAGQGWAAAVQVPGLTTSSSSVGLVTGRLVMDANGTATWIRHNFETRRYTAAGGWSATAFVPAASSGGEVADVTVDAAGAVHMLGVGPSDVLYSRLPAGSSQWSAWADVSVTNLATRSPRLALGAQGSVIAIWRERNPGDTNDSMKANRTVGGTWQTPVRIEELLPDVTDAIPRLATDGAGNAIAAWHQNNAIVVNRFDATTGTWGTPTELDAGQVSSTSPTRIQLAMAADGRAVLVWNSGLFALKSSSFTPGAGFSAPLVVNSYSSGHFAAIDGSGRAVVVYRAPTQWPNPTDATLNLYSRELPAGGAWTAAALLETGAGEVKSNVPCAASPSGDAVCAWAQDDLANNTIRNSLLANVRR